MCPIANSWVRFIWILVSNTTQSLGEEVLANQRYWSISDGVLCDQISAGMKDEEEIPGYQEKKEIN